VVDVQEIQQVAELQEHQVKEILAVLLLQRVFLAAVAEAVLLAQALQQLEVDLVLPAVELVEMEQHLLSLEHQ
jgi:hypothetical protein